MSEFTSIVLLQYDDHFNFFHSNLHPEEAPECCPIVAENFPGAICHHVHESVLAASDYVIQHYPNANLILQV